MKLHRFIGNFDLSKKEVEIINPENIKQIKSVLRMSKGDKIILSNGKGNEAEVAIDSISVNKIVCIVSKMNEPHFAKASRSEYRKVNLYLSILKKENFELSVQKAVEVGVFRIIPVITERTIKTGLNMERLNKIILEASEQCGRSIVPTLSPIFNFKDALKDGENSQEKILFDVDPANKFYTPNKNAENISIFIGPEGGFTEKEVNLAKNSDYIISSLGPLTLRGETAAIIATYRAVECI